MKNIRSIYSQDPGIRLPELRLLRVRLNRHLPEAQWIADHRHAYAQILLYLGGTGCQEIAGQTHLIEKGHLFSFLRASGTLSRSRQGKSRFVSRWISNLSATPCATCSSGA